MTDKKADRRVIKTERMINSALMELLKEKSVREIKVSEISELADINRGTFYLHYRDVYDILERIEGDMFDSFNRLLDSHPVSELDQSAIPFLRDIYGFLSEYHEMCRALLGPHGDPAFAERLHKLVCEKCAGFRGSFTEDGSEADFDYRYYFAVGGIMGIVRRWIDGGMKESPDDMAVLTESILHNGVKRRV